MSWRSRSRSEVGGSAVLGAAVTAGTLLHGEVVASVMASDDIRGEAVAAIGWAGAGIDTGVSGTGFLACCGAWCQTIIFL